MRGKANFMMYTNITYQDHPRLCGEKISHIISFTSPLGSPPPMRGKVIRRQSGKVQIGITPAYAGKRPLYSQLHQVFQDHPRLCGEKRLAPYARYGIDGSPPPMRGKALELNGASELIGITPAYAGKSNHEFKPRRSDWDHPRLCGEKGKKYR